MSRKLLVVLAGGIVALGVVAGGVYLGSNVLAKPEANDYSHLDNQRKILNESVQAYGPIFNEFSVRYVNAFKEERSKEETSALYDSTAEQLERERDANEDRLESMRTSRALKDDALKKDFEQYEKSYTEAFDYYDKLFVGVAGALRVIQGTCAPITKMSVAKAAYFSDFVKKTDVCLKELAEAKTGGDPQTAKLLSNVETMFRERRDAAQKVAEKEGVDKNLAKIDSLLLLLEVNTLIPQYLQEFDTDIKKVDADLSSKLNAADGAFAKSIEKQRASAAQEGR